MHPEPADGGTSSDADTPSGGVRDDDPRRDDDPAHDGDDPRHGDDPVREVTDAVMDAVMDASRVFVAISARALADVAPQLTLVQLRSLVVLDGEGPVKLAALAGALGVNPSTAMRMVDRLEAAGLVDRRLNPGNRREVLLSLTAPGRDLVARVMSRRHEEIAGLVLRLPAAERAGLVHALRALVDAAGPTVRAAVSDPAGSAARAADPLAGLGTAPPRGQDPAQ